MTPLAGHWQPYQEPLRVTLTRTLAIAAALGALIAFSPRGGGLRSWPAGTVVALWPALGGHFVELLFLNVLRPKLPPSRGVQMMARLWVWFVGGCVLAVGMLVTARLLHRPFPLRWESWWMAGAAFIVVELVAHLGMQLTGRPNFYDGRG
jgi:hypothetical protein